MISYQSLRSEKNSAAWPVTHPAQLTRDQKPADGIILIVWWTTTLQPFKPSRHTVPLWKDFKLLKHIPQFVKLVTFFKIGFPLSKWSYFKSAYILGVLPLFTRLYHTILLISIYCTMNRVVRAGWAEWARAHPLFCLNLYETSAHTLFTISRIIFGLSHPLWRSFLCPRTFSKKNLSLVENIFAGARMPILRHPLVLWTLVLKIPG